LKKKKKKNGDHGVERIILYDSYIRFKNLDTNTWIHIESKEEEEVKILKVEASTERNEEDVFNIKKVKEFEIKNIQFAQSVFLPLNIIYQKIQKKQNIKEDFLILIHILSELIIFCTESNQIDPLIREGIPIYKRQNIIREFDIVNMIVEILIFLIDDEKRNNLDRNYFKIFTLGIFIFF
jgi:hypothetical protein